MALIEPRTMSGFRDYPPALMIPRERVLQTARDVYRSYGYSPIDTPAVESLDVLLGKGGEESDKLVYRVKSAKGEKEEMGLRFDLTVPFARFSAKHVNESGLPFKRYAMGPVWRGERPGQGRFREFWQCDFDTIGTTSNAADIECVLVINDLFKALHIDGYQIRINNRLILNGGLESLGIPEKAVPVLRSIDKLAKIGREKVIEEMCRESGVTSEQADKVMVLVAVEGTSFERLDTVTAMFGTNDKVNAGVTQLRELLTVAKSAGVDDHNICVDLSIARGLDYYTGTIFETVLTDPAVNSFGSVCSGGRYDNLASLYTKQVLPGVGASLGVDRLLAAMEEMKHPWLSGAATPAPVLILNLGMEMLGEYQKIARSLRSVGIGAEVYPDAKKPGPQFQYAEKRGFKVAITVGPTEIAAGTANLKNLAQRKQETVSLADLVSKCQAELEAK